jgi:hypothetical protein
LTVTAGHADKKRFFLLLPLAGFLAFVLFYIIASSLYPGGSNTDKFEKGFSILHNYWCDLTAGIAKNGEVNKGQPFALTALIILCGSTILLMFFLPKLVKSKTTNRKIVYCAGAIGIGSLLFLPTSYHDRAITVGGFAGIVAFIAAFIGLYRTGYRKIVAAGIVCVFLLSLNYLIYQSGTGLIALPLLQKITFIALLSWLSAINILVYRQANNKGLAINR